MKALADDWVALEDEEDDDDGEGEEVMSALFVEEEEDEKLTLSQMERKSKCLSCSSQPYPMYSCVPKADIVSFE